MIVMNYIVTEKQLEILTENITSSNFSTELTGLIKEQSLTTPYRVMGGFTVPANEQSKCDALHGFQLERTGANMNGKVKEELDKFSGQGVWVSNVEVTVDINKLKVDWVATIDRSDDGEFWNGFTSRGAGCNNDIENRWKSEDVGNGPNSITSKIKEVGICNGDVEIQLVKKFDAIFTGNNSQFSFIQGFYRYKCESRTRYGGNQMKKTFAKSSKENNPNSLKDYEGSYTFVSKEGEKTVGNVKEENGKLLVSRGNDSFYLTKTETDQFEGKVRVSHEQDKRIPKIMGYITIDINAKFNRNNNSQVCSVDGVAKWSVKKENIVATKDGVSCTDSPVVKPVTPDSTTVKPSTTDSTKVPVEKPTTVELSDSEPKSNVPKIKKVVRRF